MVKMHDYSLRRRLFLRLSAPIVLVLILGAVAAFTLARHIGSIVHDRWLYDSTMSLARQIKVENGKAVLHLPKPAIEMFEWDSVDRIFEEVQSQKHGPLFSNAAFSSPGNRSRSQLVVEALSQSLGNFFPSEHEVLMQSFDCQGLTECSVVIGKPRFYDSVVNGQSVRVAAVEMANPIDASDRLVIRVAETRRKRDALASYILWRLVPLQVLILALAGVLIWLAVTSSLRVVDNIASRLADYEPQGLVPVSELAHTPTEIRPLLNSINRLIAKLADAQQTQRRFIANAAHQLRTPLATLQVQTERALRESDPAKHGEALSHVLTAVTRARHLMHQLLTLMRSEESGGQTMNMMEVDLATLARDELERWADAAIARDIDLGYDGPESKVWIHGEPHLLHELIGNLVDNAIRYGRPGGQVTLGLTTSPTVALTVDDNGPGIPTTERALVQERFYRRSGAPGDGCGLGLAIAREIANRHQARLNILDNPRGSGTRVQLDFAE